MKHQGKEPTPRLLDEPLRVRTGTSAIEALIYLLAITLAEIITVSVQPIWGAIFHTVILAVLIVHSAVATSQLYRQLLLSLTLVPLVRIVSLSMPLAELSQLWWYPIIYASLLVAAVVIMRLLNYKAEHVGLSLKRLRIQLLVAASGLIFGVAEYFILAPSALVTEFTWQQVWLPALILLASTGFVEELIFRGVLQHGAVATFGWWGIVYISLLFAILHMGFLSWIDIAFVFGVALFFGWVVKKTGSLFGVTLSHGITNIVLYLIAPFFF